MALALDAAVGGISSNSYDTVANAELYFDGRINKQAWTDADTADKPVVLVHATTVLDAEIWNGEKANSEQRLKWPRFDVLDDDGLEVDATIIPKEIKEAIFELALVLLGSDIQSHTGLEKFNLLKVGEIEIEPKDGIANVLPDEVTKLISRFQASGSGSRRIRG